MVYNAKYQQKAYIIIICIKINVNIYAISCEMIWLSKLVLLYEPGTVHELFMD